MWIRGSAAYNEILAEKRARAFGAYLSQEVVCAFGARVFIPR